MRNSTLLLASLVVLAACSADGGETEAEADDTATGTETPIPVEPDGGIGDGAGPPEDVPPAEDADEDGDRVEEPSAFAQTFPVAIRGKWRATEGDAVTPEECDGYEQENMGKVLTVREDRFSYFETGGRFISVSDREPGRIRALFDTTYADEETRDELEFRVDTVAKTLTVRNFDTGERSATTYRRCPR